MFLPNIYLIKMSALSLKRHIFSLFVSVTISAVDTILGRHLGSFLAGTAHKDLDVVGEVRA